MKKRIALITAVVTLGSASGVFAEINQPSYDMFSNTVTVSGTTQSGEKNRNVSVKVMNPSGTNGESTLQFADYALSGENGEFSFSFTLHMDGTDDYGKYKISVGGYDYDTPKEFELYIAGDDEIASIINDINTLSASELANKFGEYMKKLNLNFDLLDEVSENEVIRIVKNESALKKFSVDDMQDAFKRIKGAVVAAAYNEGKKELVLSNDGLLYTDLLRLDEIDTDGVTLYSVYGKLLSSEGKKKLHEKLFNQKFDTVEDWQNEFLTQIVLNTIASPSVGGVVYVQDVITERNAAKIGLEVNKYLTLSDKSSINSNVARKSYSSLSALKTALEPKTVAPSGGGGGGSTGGSGSSVRPVPPSNDNETLKFKLFNDIPENYWLFSELYEMKEKGIFTGDSDNNFRPNSPIKREEFAKILCKALHVKTGENIPKFTDVDDNAWYKDYVYAAASNEIILGREDGSFGVGQRLTREDLCVMLYRAINAAAEDVGNPVFSFNDDADIADYAKAAVDYMYVTKIVSGYEDHSFKPKAECTRAHAAKILYKTLERVNELNQKEEDNEK